VRHYRDHVVSIDDTIAVDILRAAVAGAEVGEDLEQVGRIDDAIAVEVPKASTVRGTVRG